MEKEHLKMGINDMDLLLDKIHIYSAIVCFLMMMTVGYTRNDIGLASFVAGIYLILLLLIVITRKCTIQLISLRDGKNSEVLRNFNLSDIGEFSDGYHTFNSLYDQRLYLFATLVNTYKDISWKSKRHSDNKKCFDGGWFIVGIDTPEGQYTYHYEMKYWDLFDCQELSCAKEFDGHTDKDVGRLLSLIKK